MHIEQRDGVVIITLPTGEAIRIYAEDEGRLGCPSCRVRIVSEKALLVLPSSSNAIEVSTAQALAHEQAMVVSSAAARRARR